MGRFFLAMILVALAAATAGFYQVICVQKPGVAHFRTRRVATATDIGYNIITCCPSPLEKAGNDENIIN
jgi:hypothetical protein